MVNGSSYLANGWTRLSWTLGIGACVLAGALLSTCKLPADDSSLPEVSCPIGEVNLGYIGERRESHVEGQPESLWDVYGARISFSGCPFTPFGPIIVRGRGSVPELGTRIALLASGGVVDGKDTSG